MGTFVADPFDVAHFDEWSIPKLHRVMMIATIIATIMIIIMTSQL